MAGRTGQPFARLLAKSSRTPETPREAETLAGHLMDVTAVAVAIAEHWGTAAATSMALPEEATSALRRVLPRAAFLHDLGKANDHFQRMVRSPGQVKQAIRHEVLSVWLLLREPALDAWLFAGCSPDERQAVLVAAAGHHLQLEGLSNLRPAEGSGATAVQVLAGHSDMYAALARGSSQFDGTPPRLSTLAIDLLDSEFSRTMRQWFRESTAWWEQVSAETRRFTALVKALLVATDVAGSAVPRQGEDAATWAVERLSRTCRPEALEDVVAERL
jgi:CRISPR-associated endonuclease/helicase Cas3